MLGKFTTKLATVAPFTFAPAPRYEKSAGGGFGEPPMANSEGPMPKRLCGA